MASLVPLSVVGEYRVAAQLAIGFTVAQHYTFLGLPWQMRQIGALRNPGLGHSTVIWRQRSLIGMALAALIVLSIGAKYILILFGWRFQSLVPVLQLLLLLRFSDLLWGPQHEILVSNGRALEDAHVNMAAIAVWLAAFSTVKLALAPIGAAIVAAGFASVFAQGARRWILTRAELRAGAGHAFGPALPIALVVLASIAAIGL